MAVAEANAATDKPATTVNPEGQNMQLGVTSSIEHNYALYNFLLQNCVESVQANGVKLRKVWTTTIHHVYYPNITGGTALDVDATVFPIVLGNPP